MMTTATQQINNILGSITFETDWQPNKIMLDTIFRIVTNQVFSHSQLYQPYREDSELFGMLTTKEPMLWFWNAALASDRVLYLNRLIYIYGSKSPHYGGKIGQWGGMAPENQAVIIDIVRTVYDALPLESDDIEIQKFRISLLRLPINRQINFLEELKTAIFIGNKELISFWTTEGQQRSADPAFFGLLWSRIKRSEGYVAQRSVVINNANRCSYYPEIIISELIAGGHSGNKVDLVIGITNKIHSLKDAIRKNFAGDNREQQAMIDIHRATLARFVGSEDYNVLRHIIPHLAKNDLLFAAPAASRLGLTKILDVAMSAKD